MKGEFCPFRYKHAIFASAVFPWNELSYLSLTTNFSPIIWRRGAMASAVAVAGPILTSESPRVVITTGPSSPRLCVDVLQHSAASHSDYWHARYRNVEACLYQVKAELASVLEREGSLIARNMELERMERCFSSALEDAHQKARNELACKQEVQNLQLRLEAALKNGKSKEELCEHLRLQLRSKVAEIDKSKEELQKLRTDLNKAQELHHRSMSELRAMFEGQLEKLKEELRLKEQDLQIVRISLAKQEERNTNVVSEVCDLRQRLEAAMEQEAKHIKMVDLLQSERDLWLSRSDHYEKNYYSCLRRGVHSLASQPAIDITITPTPPSHPAPRRCCRGPVRLTWCSILLYH